MSENVSSSLAHYYSRQLQKNSKPVLNPAWPMKHCIGFSHIRAPPHVSCLIRQCSKPIERCGHGVTCVCLCVTSVADRCVAMNDGEGLGGTKGAVSSESDWMP